MTNFLKEKAGILLTILLGVFVLLGVSHWYRTVCKVDGCSVYFLEAVLEPVQVFSYLMIVIPTIFLALPIIYWKRWLKYIASWYLPIGFVIVAGIDPLSSNLLNPTRAQMVEILGYGLMALTVLSVGHSYLKSRRAN